MRISPFMTRGDHENYCLRTDLVVDQGRLSYRDERPADRDKSGVLWARQISSDPPRTPVFGRVNTARQRQAALELLCQVCGGEPDRDGAGILWLVPGRGRAVSGPGLVVAYPPICLPCCGLSLRTCPTVRAEHRQLRVRSVRPAGVNGVAFTADCRPRPGGPGNYLYDESDLALVLAFQQLLLLSDYTVTSVVGSGGSSRRSGS